MTAYSTYTVRISAAYPAWNMKDGVKVEVIAATKADAIKRARDVNFRECYFDRINGRITYKVVGVE